MYLNRNNYSLPESLVTPEKVYLNRRTFLKAIGYSGISIWPLLAACENQTVASEVLNGTLVNLKALKYSKNTKYSVKRPLTERNAAAKYTNFYEFTSSKSAWKYINQFITRPWQVSITGLVNKPMTIDIDDLIKKVNIEERIYRHRCVETWAMVVPWVGFSLRDLIKMVEPKSSTKYVSMLTFLDQNIAPKQKLKEAKNIWPYQEALSIEEANNELAFLAVGVYGKELPKQHGAPIRLVIPWKYGFKSIKSIVEINFTDKKPDTFWNMIQPQEYGFWANINPEVPHLRWSQKTEYMLGTKKVYSTKIYNGYGDYVANLYGTNPGKEYFF